MFLYVPLCSWCPKVCAVLSWIRTGGEEELGGHAPNSPSENGEETHLGIFRLPTPGSLHRRRENTAQEEFGFFNGRMYVSFMKRTVLVGGQICFVFNQIWDDYVLYSDSISTAVFLQGSGSLSWTSQANGPDSVTARTLAPGLAQLDWLGPLLAGTPPFGQLASFFCDCLLTLSTHSTLLYKIIFFADHIRNYCLLFGCASSSSSDLKAHDVVGYFHFSQRVTNPFLWPLQPCNSGLKISSTQLLARDASGNGVQAGLLKQIGTQH